MTARDIFVFVLPLALGGCFLLSQSPRPDPSAFPGPAVYAETCQTCHPAPPGYAESLHSAMGIRCGQCHPAGDHPDFREPVRDGTCGGCHQPEFQQTLESAHFATRAPLPLDGDRAARTALRRNGFTVPVDGSRRFAGDTTSNELGGRLCAACHFDEHRLGLRRVRQADFCVGCHADKKEHFTAAGPDPANRCVSCHVRIGDSVTGQVVNTHRFTR